MNKYLFILIVLFTIVNFSCKNTLETQAMVAKVNKDIITLEEFNADFSLFPRFRPNSKMRDARQQHIEAMLNRLILKTAAEKDGLDNEQEIKNHIEYIKHKEMLKALYNKEVLNKINISDDEAWDEYKRLNIKVRIRHLFSETRNESKYLYKRIKNGEKFSDLAKEIFLDSTLANNGGDLGYLYLADLDPFLIDSVYNLKIGHISKPLKSSYGFHIVKIENVKQSSILDTEMFKQNKENYIQSLQRRRAQIQSASYVASTLKGKSVNIKNKVITKLLYITKDSIQERRQEVPVFIPNVTNYELQNIFDKIQDIKENVLVEFEGIQWTVRDFLNKIKQMPALHRPIINNRRLMLKNIVDTIRDELLLKEAYDQKLDKLLEVRQEIIKWKNKLLADEYEKRILMAGYKELDLEKWKQRKKLYQHLKETATVTIDTSVLYKNLSSQLLNKKVPKIKTVIRENYIW